MSKGCNKARIVIRDCRLDLRLEKVHDLRTGNGPGRVCLTLGVFNIVEDKRKIDNKMNIRNDMCISCTHRNYVSEISMKIFIQSIWIPKLLKLKIPMKRRLFLIFKATHSLNEVYLCLVKSNDDCG